MKYLSIDIGGSSVKGAIVDLSSKTDKIIFTFNNVLLEKNIDHLIKSVFKVIDALNDYDSKIKILGISTTGSVTPEGVVRRAGFIPGYENFDWKNQLKDFQHAFENVFTINDGRASVLGSFINENLDTQSLAHFVIGTGIGGGFIESGKLFVGAHGLAGNFGHIKVEHENGLYCSCRKRGCLENYAASQAIIRYASDFSGNKDNMTIQDLSSAIKSDNEYAINAFKKAGYFLGIGLSDVMNILDPHIITLGGGIVEAARLSDGKNIYVEEAIKVAKEFAKTKIAEKVTIKESSIGNDAGLLGAAYYCHQNIYSR